MKIKVCGLKYPDNIEAVAALSPDYIGLITYSRSPRFVSQMPADALNKLPSSVLKTAVFVDETTVAIAQLIEDFNLDAIQLHGKETADFAAYFKGKVQVIKAFGVDESFDFDQLAAYAGNVDYFLFDTKTEARGGSGKTFNWALLEQYTLDVPFFLSGGLSMANLEQVAAIRHPQFYGVDLNSRFESAPALKDIEKLKQAFTLLKQPTTHEIRS